MSRCEAIDETGENDKDKEEEVIFLPNAPPPSPGKDEEDRLYTAMEVDEQLNEMRIDDTVNSISMSTMRIIRLRKLELWLKKKEEPQQPQQPQPLCFKPHYRI